MLDGTETFISVSYDDTDGNLDFVVPVLDEDNMASNSASHLATQQSIKAYVDAEVAGLVDSAPSALNTLNELAAALGDDASFSTTTATSLGNRLRVDVSNQGLTSTQQANALTNLGITASLAEINILDDGLAASDIPNLATSKITSGTFADARIAESNVTQHLAAGTGLDLSGKTFSVDVSDFMTNGSNNRILTATGTDAMNAEANLTFDGDTLQVTTTGTGDTLVLESSDAPAQDNDMAPNLVLLRSGIPAASTNTDAGKIQFKALDSDGGTTRTLAHIQSEFNTATGSNGSGRMRFNVASSGGSGHNDYEYMRFDGGVRDVIINEFGQDIDFRIEGDSDTALFFTDASSDKIGIGTTSPTHKLQVNGDFAATTKSFDIEHPTKEGMRLHHGSLEGPEHGVYIRGRLEGNEIDLPEYWLGLVDEDTITVQLTPNKGFQQIYVEDISDNKVYVGTQSDKPINCFYFIQAERKDVDKMEVEY